MDPRRLQFCKRFILGIFFLLIEKYDYFGMVVCSCQTMTRKNLNVAKEMIFFLFFSGYSVRCSNFQKYLTCWAYWGVSYLNFTWFLNICRFSLTPKIIMIIILQCSKTLQAMGLLCLDQNRIYWMLLQNTWQCLHTLHTSAFPRRKLLLFTNTVNVFTD